MNINIPGEEKFYLSIQGLKKIKKEYEVLKEIKLAKTRRVVAPEILHSEDLNPEYLSFQENLNLLEKKITELENILKNAELIKAPPAPKRNIICLGAEVSVEIDGDKDKFKIVGTLEANPVLGKISNESPVGKALLGHRVGDEVVISSPIKVIYRIKKIKYKN